MANSVEQMLLLPRDITKLRNLKKHELFLSLKKDMALVNYHFPFFLIYFNNFIIINFSILPTLTS